MTGNELMAPTRLFDRLRLWRKRHQPAPGPRTPVQVIRGAAKELVLVLGMAVVISWVIKSFLVQAFFIPSQSMEGTLLIGDRVLVSKLTPGPVELHRGDVLVFEDPGHWLSPSTNDSRGTIASALHTVLVGVGLLPQDSDQHLIKRVIGLPGDKVTCCDSSGRLQVNGVPVNEPYLKPGVVPSTMPFDITVGPDSLWMMGDNRSSSSDSRVNGQVPLSKVVGKAFAVVWPLSRIGGVSEPDGVFDAVTPATGSASPSTTTTTARSPAAPPHSGAGNARSRVP